MAVVCVGVNVWSMSGVCVWCIGMKCGVYVLVVCVYGVVYEWSVCGVSGVSHNSRKLIVSIILRLVYRNI